MSYGLCTVRCTTVLSLSCTCVDRKLILTLPVTDLVTSRIASVLLNDLAVGKHTLLQSFDSLEANRISEVLLAEVVVLALTDLGISTENVVALVLRM